MLHKSEQHWLQEFINKQIPITAQMKVSVDGYDDTGALCLSAPLSANHNDKGSAFAGSLGAVMTLAGWGQVALWLREQRLSADVMIVRCEQHFKAPVLNDFTTTVKNFDNSCWDGLLNSLERKGRGRIEFEIETFSNGQYAAVQQSSYAVILRTKEKGL